MSRTPRSGLPQAPDDVAVPPRRGQTRAVVAGGIVSSLAAYAFQVLGARTLGDAAYAPVGILWTLQYLVLTVGLLSTEAHVTRRGGASRGVWLWVLGLAVLVGGGVALAGRSAFGSASPAWPVAAAGTVLGFGLFAIVRGQLAADRRLHAYGLMTGGESVIRLVAAIPLLALGGGAAALALTLPVGAMLAGLPWLRRVHPSSGEDDRALPFLASTTVANGAAQTLLAAGPLAVAAIGGAPALVTLVFVTTTAARAPMVFVHSGLLARILPPMQALAADGRQADLRRQVDRGTPPTVGVLALVAIVGASIGPPLVALTFGADLRPSSTFAALTALAVALAMLGLVLNQVAISASAHARLLLPWTLGVAVAVVVLVATRGVGADLRVGAASAAGLGVAVVGVRIQLDRLLRPPAPAA